MIRRLLEARLDAALRDTPCVVVHGPRQSGKTTLVRDLLPKARKSVGYRTLDDASVLQAATDDPSGFVDGLDTPVVVDEVQRAPGLPLALKAAIDRDRRPGRFILSGSADVMALPRLAQALAGRVEVLALWPLAQAEIEGTAGRFVDDLFERRRFHAPDSPLDDVLPRVIAGGFPEPLARPTPARRKAWFESYVTTVMQRDVAELAHVQRLAELPRLLGLVAARTAGLLNRADLARDAGIPPSTLERHLALFEATFLVRLLPAWHANLGKRLAKAPKLVMIDTGLAAHLMGMDAAGVSSSNVALGPLLETFAITEIMKLAAAGSTRPRALHYRSHSGGEVDLVLEDDAGRIVGVEVKSSRGVKAEDFRGLRDLAALAGKRFVQGVLLHPGEQIVPFGHGLSAVPLSALWAAAPARR